MPTLVVVSNPRDWPLEIPGLEVVSARAYLTDPHYSQMRWTKVFNLCRSLRYQGIGYYVSLLAAARGHKPIPSVTTIQDMKSVSMIRAISDDLHDLINKSLAGLHHDEFVLSIYFGRNVARKYDRLAWQLFNLFQAPLLRAEFNKNADGEWQLEDIDPFTATEIPNDHRPLVIEFAQEYFSSRRTVPKRTLPRYDLAILHNPDEVAPPSDEKALARFQRAAESLGFGVEMITKDDYGRIAEFDALFIRETTAVNHHTYRFSRRAAAEGLIVYDDPESIVRCANKVYLAELLQRHKIPTPQTMIVHRDNIDQIPQQIGFPCVLKQPDGSFSRGVVKVENPAELEAKVEELLDDSDLIIAQEFVPTPFDWRIGIFDRQPLFACRYYMVKKHWQIANWNGNGTDRDFGRVETIPVEQAPHHVIQTALRAANLIGDGLYGVDLKEVGRKSVIIEINDNPNIDAGFEDAVLKDDLYLRIMQVYLSRLERRAEGVLRA